MGLYGTPPAIPKILYLLSKLSSRFSKRFILITPIFVCLSYAVEAIADETVTFSSDPTNQIVMTFPDPKCLRWVLPGLFNNYPAGTEVYNKEFPGKTILSFRTLNLGTDITFLHQWVNHPAAKPFWQMDGPMDFLRKAYKENLDLSSYGSFIGYLNGNPVCQADAYQLLFSEINDILPVTESDYGIHFLMAPATEKIQHLSICCMQTFLSFLFSCDPVDHVYGEPDVLNQKANRLVLKAGFEFLYPVSLAEKQANLYCLSKESFHKLDLYTFNC